MVVQVGCQLHGGLLRTGLYAGIVEVRPGHCVGRHHAHAVQFLQVLVEDSGLEEGHVVVRKSRSKRKESDLRGSAALSLTG